MNQGSAGRYLATLLACFTLLACDPEEIVTPDVGRVSQNFDVRGTVEQVYIWNAEPESDFELLGENGELAARGTTDYLGSLVLRELPPGDGYRVQPSADTGDYTAPVTVMSVGGSQPDASFYTGQELVEGFQYITMRDGTTLSANVWLPGPIDEGPYPTIVNYSGYSPSRPSRPLGEDLEPFCENFPVLCNAPDHGAGMFAGLMGYASVGVNVRGTGCSGGAYDYFEPLQLLDGYDVIEIVSRQEWVKHNQVGMAGLSYPGITQLFVASTQPPGLAAIAPMSVIADSATSCLAPGGIYNIGFALAWVENVLDKAQPYGHGWIEDLVAEGDAVCEENQLLHDQRLDVVQKAYDNPYYTDEIAKPLDPSSFADQIQVPVYLAGQWQDEQTGPHFAALLDKFTSSPSTRFMVSNGVHPDGWAPQELMEWKTFLDLYVDREVPHLDDDLRTAAPLFFQMMFGTALDLPENRFEDYTSFEQARADFEAENPLVVFFESGADEGIDPGAPQATFVETFAAWPVPETVAARWYLQPDGSLTGELPPADGGASSFVHDPAAGDRVTRVDGSVWDNQPSYDYRPLLPDYSMAFETEPLVEDRVMIGHGSVDLWMQSTADDADLEVNLTEVRPDGMESFVQSGWLRASHRALREDATELRPVKSHYEEDAAPLPAGEWEEVRVEIMPFAHIFRAGSRIRLSVDTPGDSRWEWRFILQEYEDEPTHHVAHQLAYPSSVALPWIPDVDVPTGMPDCTALRGQPCRAYEPLENVAMD